MQAMNSTRPNPKCQPIRQPELEDAILGSLLLMPWRFAEAAHLAPSDFMDEGHQRVFAAMKNLAARGLVPDASTVCGELRRTGQYSADHGASAGHLAECLRLAPSGHLLPQYVAELRPKPTATNVSAKLARERRRGQQ